MLPFFLVNRFLKATIFLIVLLLLPLPAKSAVQVLHHAEFVMSDSIVPPAIEMGWKPVSLTHYWQTEQFETGRNGWYRLTLELTETPVNQLGIYIRRMNMNAAIYINDTFLKDGGSFEEPLSRNWNRPLFTPVPTALWESGKNTITIRLKSYPQYAYLSPIVVGATDVLSAEYDLQSLLQTGIGAALFPVTLAVAVFILGLWIRRRHDVQYLWFSLAVLAWSGYSLNMFIVDLPVSTKSWEWFAHSSVDWWVIFFSIFAYRFINQPQPRLEKLYVIFGITASVVYALIDFETMRIVVRWFHGLDIIIGFITTWILFASGFIHKNKNHLFLAFGLLVLLMTGLHDWMFQTRFIAVTGTMSLHLHHYTAPLVFLFMAWHLSGRFITALNESELLNRELEDRVELARHELEQYYQKVSDMQQTQAVSTERERLSREIHDGMSGNISNSIMMTELLQRQFKEADLSEVVSRDRFIQLRGQLEEALGEMRNLMLTMENDVSSLADLSSHIRDKYEQLLPSSIDLNINYDFEHESYPLSQKQSLNILRIMQEILANINQHAQAEQVELSMFQSAQNLTIVVKDDGCGFVLDKPSNGHYGVRNLGRRSEEIKAVLLIETSPEEGCEIKLAIPLD